MKIKKNYFVLMLLIMSSMPTFVYGDHKEYEEFNFSLQSVAGHSLKMLLPNIPKDGRILLVGDKDTEITTVQALCKCKWGGKIDFFDIKKGISNCKKPEKITYNAVIFAVCFGTLLFRASAGYIQRILNKYSDCLAPDGYFLFSRTKSEDSSFKKAKLLGGCLSRCLKKYMTSTIEKALIIQSWRDSFSRAEVYKHTSTSAFRNEVMVLGFVYCYQK